MKKSSWAMSLVLALVLALSLAGCGTAMTDASTVLVQGNLDEIYLGKYDPAFLELVNTTEEQAEANYIQGLETEADYFAYYFSIDYMDDTLQDEIVELYKEIYSHSRYEVGEATKVDDSTYGVPVTIYPIDIMQTVYDQADAAIAEFNASYSDDEMYLIENDEAAYAEYDAAWARMWIQLCRDNLDSIGYLEPQEMVVQVKQDSDGLWTIYDDDFNRIDVAMIYYP